MTQQSLAVPVAFLIFNRPEHTARVLERIRLAKPDVLLVVADGPRGNVPDDTERCRLTREVIEGVDWPCTVLKNYADENIGCRMRVATGIDWVFSQVEEAIILEDDCLPHQTFFAYCEELLARYRHDPRIAIIRGDDWPGLGRDGASSYCFSMYPSTWGWATWRRVWNNYDVHMADFSAERDLDWIAAHVGTQTMARYWLRAFEAVKSCCVDTWDLQLVYTCWRQGQLSIVPRVNLVTNIGGTMDATHTRDESHPRLNRPLIAMPEHMVHPLAITPDRHFDQKGELKGAVIERFAHGVFSDVMAKLATFFYR